MTCVSYDALTSLQTAEIHPLYDFDAREWVVVIDGREVCAKDLRALQAKLPDVRIKDYWPDGLNVVYEGSVTESCRTPVLGLSIGPRAMQKGRVARSRAHRPKVPKAEEPKPTIEPTIEPPVPEPVPEEPAEIKVIRALRPRPTRRPTKMIVAPPARAGDWPEEHQRLLIELAAQRLSAAEIGPLLGRTRGSIIGRCHRTGVQLLCTSRERNRGSKSERRS